MLDPDRELDAMNRMLDCLFSFPYLTRLRILDYLQDRVVETALNEERVTRRESTR